MLEKNKTWFKGQIRHMVNIHGKFKIGIKLNKKQWEEFEREFKMTRIFPDSILFEKKDNSN